MVDVSVDCTVFHTKNKLRCDLTYFTYIKKKVFFQCSYSMISLFQDPDPVLKIRSGPDPVLDLN